MAFYIYTGVHQDSFRMLVVCVHWAGVETFVSKTWMAVLLSHATQIVGAQFAGMQCY